MSASRRPALFTTRTALLLGFGGLLALLAFSGLDAMQVLSQIQLRNEEIRREYVERSRKLEQIRSAVYLSGTYVRDYLLEPNPRDAEKHRASLNETRKEIDAELRSYEKLFHPGEEEPLHVLEQELAAYWRSLEPVFIWTPEQRREQGYAFLRDEVFPRRMSMLSIADRVADVNERQLNLGDRRLSDLFLGFRNRLLITLAVTLGLGLLLAAASVRHTLGLERETARHLRDVLQARGELKELSTRLVEAQEIERKAISRELHDAVGQSLSAVLVELRNLGAALPADSTNLRAHVETTRRLVESAVGLVRNMALLLRPSMLDDLGLVPALQWQARDVSKRTGMLINVAADELPEDLPDEHKTCIYRIVQEALNNCSKHADAENVRITVREEGGNILLSVQDDGKGFTPGQERGLGLLGIQERVANLGGNLQIDSEMGRGTLLMISLPLQSRDRQGEVTTKV